ncbi:MAG: SlyX family protein [Limisphaerales bacterium]
MDESLASRLLKVESALAHLEHQQEELNQVVVEQARLIGRLQKEVARASDAMEGQELERIRANNQKPPHYQ